MIGAPLKSLPTPNGGKGFLSKARGRTRTGGLSCENSFFPLMSIYQRTDLKIFPFPFWFLLFLQLNNCTKKNPSVFPFSLRRFTSLAGGAWANGTNR